MALLDIAFVVVTVLFVISLSLIMLYVNERGEKKRERDRRSNI